MVATRSLKKLVEEFEAELTAMNVNVAKLEDKIYQQMHRNERFSDLQQEYLKRTGTDLSAYTRGWFDLYRGFGNSSIYGPMQNDDIMLMEMRLKSVPVPSVLFDARIRIYRTIGLYYADPITNPLNVRWISLSSFTEGTTFVAGDFYKRYTPLTLWNYEIPDYNFIEPTSYKRNRQDVEELVYMDHGPDWHLRGLQAAGDLFVPKDDVLSHFKLQAMAGEMKSATTFSFGSYYAGSQASMSFFSDNVEFIGTGLMLWDDPSSASVPYLPDFSTTFPRQNQIGSWKARANLPIDTDVYVAGSVETAYSQYQDDVNNPQRVFQDWAVLADGSINIQGVHLTGKYLNIGPYFYSPGAQTSRYSSLPGSQGYVNSNYLDSWLDYSLNGTPFQNAQRPEFATYDRMVENVLPYGDATPNRLGMILGFSADIGDRGWMKPQASYILDSGNLGMHEIQPNWVLNGAGTGGVAVESGTPTQNARKFGGWEGALSADIAKALDMKGSTYNVAIDYKNQRTYLGLNGSPYSVNTFISGADFNLPVQGFDSLVWSLAFESAKSTGSEYVLSGGSPPTDANYPFYLDTSSIGNYSYQALNITRTSWAFGLLYPLTPAIHFRGDLFLNKYTWTDVPSYNRNDQIWRIAYEASF